MKQLIFLLLLVSGTMLCHAYSDFLADGLAYSINSDRESVVVTYVKDAWNWKTWNNYENETIEVPASVSDGDNTYTVTAVGDKAFNNCHNLTSVILPNTVKSLGSYSFSCCDKLEEISLPEGLETIDSYAFFNCSRLKKIVIPTSVKKFENGVFFSEIGNSVIDVYISDLSYWCSIDFSSSDANPLGRLFVNGQEISELVIPDVITELKRMTFSNIRVESITIPDHVTAFDATSFENCKAKTLHIGNGITDIPEFACAYWYNLEEVEIGENVMSVSRNAFYDSYHLKKIIIHATTPPTVSSDGVFGYDDDYESHRFTTKNMTLVVPKGTWEAYHSAEIWKDFGTILEEDEDITSIDKIIKSEKEILNVYDLAGQKLRGENLHGIIVVKGRKVLVQPH